MFICLSDEVLLYRKILKQGFPDVPKGTRHLASNEHESKELKCFCKGLQNPLSVLF